jgi:hypothetical protein
MNATMRTCRRHLRGDPERQPSGLSMPATKAAGAPCRSVILMQNVFD